MGTLRPWPYAPMRPSDLAQLRDAPHLHPFDDEDVAVVVEAGAVRADELPYREILARPAAKLLPRVDAGLAELLDDAVALVNQCHPGEQIGDDHHALAL